MPAGDVADRAHHNRHGESISNGDSEQSDIYLAVHAQVLVGADCARANEDQSECADEFGEEFLAQAVQSGAPRKNAARCE